MIFYGLGWIGFSVGWFGFQILLTEFFWISSRLRVSLGITVRLLHCDLQVTSSSHGNNFSACGGKATYLQWREPSALVCPFFMLFVEWILPSDVTFDYYKLALVELVFGELWACIKSSCRLLFAWAARANCSFILWSQQNLKRFWKA